MFGQSTMICCREDELSQYHTENQTMVNELTSLRTQNSKLQRALAKEITKVEDLQKRDSENAFRCVTKYSIVCHIVQTKLSHSLASCSHAHYCMASFVESLELVPDSVQTLQQASRDGRNS